MQTYSSNIVVANLLHNYRDTCTLYFKNGEYGQNEKNGQEKEITKNVLVRDDTEKGLENKIVQFILQNSTGN